MRIWEEEVRGGYPPMYSLTLSGLERMLAFTQGRAPRPPVHHLTGLTPVEASPGTSTFTMPSTGWLNSPTGIFQPGVLAFLADAPLGTALMTGLPAGEVTTTSDLTMSYLRPAGIESGLLTGKAKTIHLGRNLGLAEITITDEGGKVLAHGTTRCFILRFPVPDGLEPPQEDLPSYEDDPYQRDVVGDVLPQEVWNSLTGLEIMLGFINGELPPPPIHYLTGMHPTSASEGEAEFVIPATRWLTSPASTIYGGSIALLADAALSSAVQTTVPAATAFAPLDLKVNYLRPAFADDKDLVARAHVTHRGKRLAVAEAELTNAEGKTVAIATGSSLIMPGRSWSGSPLVAADEATAEDTGQ
ncbi:MAG TPA: PaaI family thioesterase [Actinomycetota bacterium]|nr:PaaI family thioesterase [Actinomycetota bacterium]